MREAGDGTTCIVFFILTCFLYTIGQHWNNTKFQQSPTHKLCKLANITKSSANVLTAKSYLLYCILNGLNVEDSNAVQL